MKAIFAVSALAAAISAQAIAADTETTTTFTGSVDVNFVLDLAPEQATYDFDMVEDGDDGAGFELDMKTEIVHGPFSGSISIKGGDDGRDKEYLTGEWDDKNNDGIVDLDELETGSMVTVELGDLKVTDGNLQFGQVGSLMSTDEYAGEMSEDGRLDVDAGLRYTVMEGLQVQIQGQNDDDMTATGLAAKYENTADALSYVVEAELESSQNAPTGSVQPYFAGLGLTYASDAVTVKAAVNAFQGYEEDSDVVEASLSLNATVAGLTLDASVTDNDVAEDDSEIVKAEVSYAAGSITPSAGYTYSTHPVEVEFPDGEKYEYVGGDEAFVKLAYAADAVEASAQVTMEHLDAGEVISADAGLPEELSSPAPKIELNVTYSLESEVKLYADYEYRAEEKEAINGAELNMVKLGAKYSF